MRKITASELLSTRRFESLRDIRHTEVKKSLMELYELGDDLKVEMKKFLGDMNLNVIMRMIAGKRYSGDETEVRKVRWVFREFFRLTGLFVVGDAIPFLGWLDLGGHVKEMKKAAIEMDSVVCGWLEEHRRRNDLGETKIEQDFVDVLLNVLDGVDLDGYDVDTVIKATCLTLIAGATDTTMVTITWALSLLLNNRHTLKKVQDELDEKVGKERLVNESDINNLVYLQAVVKETLRLYPAGPLSGARQFTEDCTVGGYHIQAGTRLILNLWKMHRDPRVWSEPFEFQPERFLDTHKDVDVKGKHYELLPFGGGRRSCPGITFGLQMTNLALASFLQAFEITTPSNAHVDMSATFGLTNIKTTPLDVIAKPRLPYHLFANEN
jgi:cytochrome P450